MNLDTYARARGSEFDQDGALRFRRVVRERLPRL